VGQFSQPIHWGQYYEIFKIIDEAPAPAHYKTSFVRGEYWEEFQNHWKELTLELKEQFAVVLNQDTIAFLVGQMSGAERRGVMLSPAEQDMVLCSFKGGQITLKDFADTYNSLWFFRSVYFDSSGVTEFINRDILPRALVYQAALQEGIDRDPPVASWLKNKKEALLLEALRDKEVVKRVVLDSAIVRQYYESHLDQFMQFEELSVVEILLASRREAEGLLQRVQDGEDMVALAASHSIRKDVENGPLHMHDHPSERRIFGSLYDEVIQADTGVLTGPVKVDGGHSIFKVIERVDRRPVSFEKAASRAQWWLRKQEERRLFDALFVHIREKHEAKVVLFEDRLQSMAID
jgi:hypothetical protein